MFPNISETLQSALKERFVFGKWGHDTADFAGRRVSVRDTKAVVHHLEKLHPIKLFERRLSDRSSPLSSEFEAFHSMLYCVNWIAHQTRPEASGIVSILVA